MGIIMHEWKEDKEASVYVLYGLSVAPSTTLLFDAAETCFNLVGSNLGVGGDNDNFICTPLISKLYGAPEGVE